MAKRSDVEHQIQKAFVQMVELHFNTIPFLRLGFGVPNGSHRHPAVAVKLKAEGVRKHVPDWILPVPSYHNTGLVIEFKAPGKYPNRGQREYHAMLRACGWTTHIERDPEQAWQTVRRYCQGVSADTIRGVISALKEN